MLFLIKLLPLIKTLVYRYHTLINPMSLSQLTKQTHPNMRKTDLIQIKIIIKIIMSNDQYYYY